MTRRCPLAALLLAALAWPTASGANVFPYGPLAVDYIRLMAGVATDFEHGAMYAGEVGWLFQSSDDEKALSIGPVAGLAVNSDVQRFSIGPHIAWGARLGPEFIYRRVDGESHLGGALHLGLEIPVIVLAAGLGGRLGVTEAGFFGELGLTFVLRIPAGPRRAAQRERRRSASVPYPRCDHDGHCVSTGRFCNDGECAECRDDAHCVPPEWACYNGDCTDCREEGACAGMMICAAGRCQAVRQSRSGVAGGVGPVAGEQAFELDGVDGVQRIERGADRVVPATGEGGQGAPERASGLIACAAPVCKQSCTACAYAPCVRQDRAGPAPAVGHLVGRVASSASVGSGRGCS